MGLSEQDVQKQIKHMIAFIDQEAEEKADEIEVKAEEEFNIEKSKLVNQQRTKIIEYYEKKMKQIDLQKKIQNSNMLNQSRLKVLRCQEEILKSLLEQARGRLKEISNDPNRYRGALLGLISQGLSQLLEHEVVVFARQQDAQLVQSLIPQAVQQYIEASKRPCTLTLDTSRYLPSDSMGGVEMVTKSGHMRVKCTLENRLESIFQAKQPDMRNLLFGENLNRKFKG